MYITSLTLLNNRAHLFENTLKINDMTIKHLIDKHFKNHHKTYFVLATLPQDILSTKQQLFCHIIYHSKCKKMHILLVYKKENVK